MSSKPRPHRGLCVLPLLAALACGGDPFWVLPGGRLTGEVVPMPADWAFVGNTGSVQLETRPEDPYSVNLLCTVVNGSLYINAGGTETRWVQNIAANPEVRMRLDGVVYELFADRVTDPAEIASFAKAWTSRSMFRRDPSELDEVWLYRVRAR